MTHAMAQDVSSHHSIPYAGDDYIFSVAKKIAREKNIRIPVALDAIARAWPSWQPQKGDLYQYVTMQKLRDGRTTHKRYLAGAIAEEAGEGRKREKTSFSELEKNKSGEDTGWGPSVAAWGYNYTDIKKQEEQRDTIRDMLFDAPPKVRETAEYMLTHRCRAKEACAAVGISESYFSSALRQAGEKPPRGKNQTTPDQLALFVAQVIISHVKTATLSTIIKAQVKALVEHRKREKKQLALFGGAY